MAPVVQLFRSIIRDRIFLYLLILTIVTFAIALWNRVAGIEQSPLPFTLVILFFSVNTLFALITLRRDTLLAYMFLTATLLLNGTLFFYYRYLQLIQAG